jgi:hypothetical protein
VAGVGGCSLPHIQLFDNAEPGLALGSGEQVALHFFTRDPHYDSGIDLRSGARYNLDITILSYWIDGNIEHNEADEPLDERGFDNSLMPWEWIGMTRRSRQHRWFELMLYQPDCKRDSLRGITDLDLDEDNGSYNFVAACDGKLTLFVNDSHGFYSNNTGYANIALSRTN